ncbi:hypothetical protein HYPSUDRAFT_61790 [Hypholoma sublateritium FD-334 SS-4]|uniref:Protein kinase domain-containing protein n=1 Tax=Hypholoma sublateritium (strain FD-334 SS-4) TaxID=945553 RepID=A0A0D2PKN0_HYPSF|nr:hypothetical protein HYPSUDRAFT_61790 [Hypholoma sublateritium FD-334 SS-4]
MSPFTSHSPALAHFSNPFYATKPQPIPADDEEGSIFLSSARSDASSTSPFFTSTTPQPLLTPVKETHRTHARPPLGPASMNTRLGPAAPSADPASATRVGVGTKRKSTPNITPLRPTTLTPLKISTTKNGDSFVAFDRLAPLPAPKFTARTPQTKAETEAYLKRQTATLTRLRLSDQHASNDHFDDAATHDSGCEMDEESDHALFLNKPRLSAKGGQFATPLLFNPPLFKGKENEEVAEAVSPGGHISKRRARSRPLSGELLEKSYKPPKSPIKSGIPCRVGAARPRHSGPVTFPSTTAHRACASPGSSSSSSDAGSPRPRRRMGGGASLHPPRPPLSRIDSVSAASLFFGPAIPVVKPPPESGPMTRSRTSSSGRAAAQASAPKRPAYFANRHSYAGPDSDMRAWTTVQTRAASPGSSPFAPAGADAHGDRSVEMDDADMFFAADDAFHMRVPISPPPPTRALPMKYAGAGSDEDEMPSTGSSTGGFAVRAMPQASTSGSSICSDDGLVTPGITPEAPSGWPPAGGSPRVFSGDVAEDTHPYVDVDAFIVRTLAAAAKAGAMPKRAPGTPVKKARMAFFGNARPWQSAVAQKVAPREDAGAVAAGGKAPRKSLPAAFHQGGGGEAGARLSATDTEEECEEDSPSVRRDRERYVGLGLGQPHAAPLQQQRTRWFMRRSSSGAFSSGSEAASASNTPTRGKAACDWQLPKPRIPPRLSPADGDALRSTSGSSSSSAATLNSPSDYRRRSLAEGGVAGAPPQHHHQLAPRPGMGVRRLSDSFTEDQHPERFERDFEEIEEIGSGEFGRVIKVRKSKTGEVYAVKKSKRFEGVKHRLRLREEVNILQHLSQAALAQYADGRHPNVLAYIDSWDEHEALYICTELCESGNLARFLWEYGRVFPRLDEARVWKITADLSNGLRFIHDSGVIHLDVKPANVFVTKEGRFKIGDFGMASLWPRPAFLDSTALGAAAPGAGLLLGGGAATAPGGGGGAGGGFEREGDKLYLAPEVLQGRYGKAADMFSFGMTILETASNIVVPDQGEGWQRLRREDFSQVDLEEDSPELAGLILAMMRTDPALRVSAEEVCAHPVVRRAGEAMDAMRAGLRAAGLSTWGASPLAGVPPDFLDAILCREGGAMDTSL